MNSSQERNEKERSKERVKKEINYYYGRVVVDVDNSDFVDALSKIWKRQITTSDLLDAAEKIGLTTDEVIAWVKYMEGVNWTFTTGDKVNCKNYRRSLRMWHITEEQIQARKSVSQERQAHRELMRKNHYEEQKAREAARREIAATKDESWALCAERCANYRADGAGCNRCKQGFKVPPPVRERPCPPESCVMFVRIEEGGEV